MNLCTNAIQAMGGDGTLRVALEAADAGAERAVAHGTLQPGAYVRLTVEDTGPGMDEATVARIFEPFFTTKEVGKGTGLGLSLVYGIVTDSGGGIDVASAPGRGSTFTIYLPRVDTPVEVADENQGPVPRGNGERVLVVDDEESLVAVTSEVLLRLGYEPVGFSDSRAPSQRSNPHPNGSTQRSPMKSCPGLRERNLLLGCIDAGLACRSCS